MFNVGLVKNLTFAIEQAARAREDINNCWGDVSDIVEPLECALSELRIALTRAVSKPIWTETKDAK